MSFRLNHLSSDDLNDILNDYKIYVMGNNFCQSGQDEFIRVSINILNKQKNTNN